MITPDLTIRKLSEPDAQAWWNLRLESLQTDPLAFGRTVEEHRATPVSVIAQRFRSSHDGNFTIGAFQGDELVGMMTFVRDTAVKARHKGRIFGVYVKTGVQGRGIGRLLLGALLESAQHSNGSIGSQGPPLEQIILAVAHTQTAARHLYRSFGFETYGIEPRALKMGDTYVDEDHMILQLETPRDG